MVSLFNVSTPLASAMNLMHAITNTQPFPLLGAMIPSDIFTIQIHNAETIEQDAWYQAERLTDCFLLPVRNQFNIRLTDNEKEPKFWSAGHLCTAAPMSRLGGEGLKDLFRGVGSQLDRRVERGR